MESVTVVRIDGREEEQEADTSTIGDVKRGLGERTGK